MSTDHRSMFVMRSLYLLTGLLIPLFVSETVFANETSNAFSAITKRLGYMQSVALYKFHNSLPIENKLREEKVLKNALNDATKSGLSPKTTILFFKAQIAVAKAIQHRYQADLLSSSSNLIPTSQDLNKEIRPALLRLGKEITILISQKINATGPFKMEDWENFRSALNNIKYVSDNDVKLLFNALKAIELKQD